jgi:hypothetical protein
MRAMIDQQYSILLSALFGCAVAYPLGLLIAAGLGR